MRCYSVFSKKLMDLQTSLEVSARLFARDYIVDITAIDRSAIKKQALPTLTNILDYPLNTS